MKKIKIIAFLMIICLAFAACSANDANPNNNQSQAEQSPDSNSEGFTEESTESYYDTLGERDFNGDTFTILDANDHPDLFINFSEEMIGDPIHDALYERDRFIEEKYNVKLEYIQIHGGNTGCSTLERAVRAGDDTYDLVVAQAQGSALDRISLNNVLHNLTDAPHLSLQSPWWSRLLYENIQFNSTLYYSGGDIFLSTYSQAPAAMMFNKRLAQDYEINEDLYKLVFEGKWTLDVFDRITKDMNIDLNNDGRMTALDDFYGYVGQSNTVTTGFWLAGLGLKFSTVVDNMINVDLTSPYNLSRIDKLSNMLEKTDYTDQNHIIDITFKGGRALFLAHCLISPQLFLRDMEDDFGVLPMPKYDENQAEYVSFMNAWSSGFVGIPMTADIERASFLMEAMAYAGHEMLRRPVYDITLKTKAVRDEESERIIDIIIETAYMDINSVYNFGGSMDILRDTVMDKAPFVSAYESREAAIQIAVERFIETMSDEN